MRALFITWDGPSQTYLESLFFPIFARIAAQGLEVQTLQLTWARPESLKATERAAARLGLAYRSLRTSRRFGLVGNLADIARGASAVVDVARSERVDMLFPRSLMPASIALLARQRLPGIGLVFDADGLMADERIDFAGWKPWGAPYRLLRAVEAKTVRAASSVIVRTKAAREILAARAGAGTDAGKIFVIPNAKSPELISPRDAVAREKVRERFGIAKHDPFVVYVGSIGPQYELGGMLRLFAAIRRRAPRARLQLFCLDPERVRAAIAGFALEQDAIRVASATPSEISEMLPAADLGLALRTETFSQRAVCPIKVAEYLLAGVPVVSTRVGDLSEQIEGRGVAHLLASVEEDDLERAADWFVRDVLPARDVHRDRCRQVGVAEFGLDQCAAAYSHALGRFGPSGKKNLGPT
jgi:glycosyltransferase involved in cell wall biosynthesis